MEEVAEPVIEDIVPEEPIVEIPPASVTSIDEEEPPVMEYEVPTTAAPEPPVSTEEIPPAPSVEIPAAAEEPAPVQPPEPVTPLEPEITPPAEEKAAPTDFAEEVKKAAVDMPQIDSDGLSRRMEDKLTLAVREMLWEIVPPLAERIIKEEIEKIKAEVSQSFK
jgi:hypothetical protein